MTRPARTSWSFWTLPHPRTAVTRSWTWWSGSATRCLSHLRSAGASAPSRICEPFCAPGRIRCLSIQRPSTVRSSSRRERRNLEASAWCSRLMPSGGRTAAAGTFSSTVDGSIWESTLWSGPCGRRSWVRERFCSPRWTAMGQRTAMTWT